MLLGETLVAHGFVTTQDIERAIERQKSEGGRIGDNLLALGLISPEVLETALLLVPQMPHSIEETGIPETRLVPHLLKLMLATGENTPSGLRNQLKLPYKIISELLGIAVEQKYVEILGTANSIRRSELRYSLTNTGRSRANEALGQNQYIGPAPVPLEAYAKQVMAQRLSNERVDVNTIRDSFKSLVIPDWLERVLGPAVNSVHSILLYGAPGNGKTTIAERVATMFQNLVFIPHAVEVEGQIIKIFDPSVHQQFDMSKVSAQGSARIAESLRREEIDLRFVPCQRPTVITGGELSLEMLDLKYSEEAGFYEAPLHMKALNGTFIIDDFGRQLVTPEQLLNRWIVPLESRVDYLKLHTGKSFQIPFDALVIFSTNLQPSQLMDPAFLRRIPYKMNIPGPTLPVYRKIFEGVAKSRGIELSDDDFHMVLESLQQDGKRGLASYQPKFIINQVIASCKYEGVPPSFTPQRVADALSNLYVEDAEAAGPTSAVGLPGSNGASAAQNGLNGGQPNGAAVPNVTPNGGGDPHAGPVNGAPM